MTYFYFILEQSVSLKMLTKQCFSKFILVLLSGIYINFTFLLFANFHSFLKLGQYYLPFFSFHSSFLSSIYFKITVNILRSKIFVSLLVDKLLQCGDKFIFSKQVLYIFFYLFFDLELYLPIKPVCSSLSNLAIITCSKVIKNKEIKFFNLSVSCRFMLRIPDGTALFFFMFYTFLFKLFKIIFVQKWYANFCQVVFYVLLIGM